MTKHLRKFSTDDRKKILQLMTRIQANDLSGLDVQKLQGRSDAYRVRKGNFRIIFRKTDTGPNVIIAVDRRSESTYRGF